MVLFKNFLNIFRISELKQKILFTLGILIVFRLGAHVPVIGIDVQALQQMMSQAKGLGGIFQYLDLFSGGMLGKCTLFALGIAPYISASIMMQMLSMAVPSLEQLVKEGEYGRKIINQYTRYLTLGVSIMQSIGLTFMLERYNLVLTPGWGFRFIFILSLAVGSMLVMWMGEQIDLFGIGNGSSMIIFAGIVSRFPDNVMRTIGQVQQGLMDPITAIIIFMIFIAIAACIVFLEKGQRKIPVQYARRVVGQRVYGGQSSYIPFKINMAGVMPVIFAGVMLNIPQFIIGTLAAQFPSLQWLAEALGPMGGLFMVIEFILIISFSFLYTALIYNPEELAENIKKSGGFIPGIRPGRKTAEFFNYILTRVGLVGSIYLAALALLPGIIRLFLKGVFAVEMPFLIGGTSLLIVVGVAVDLAARMEAYLIEHRYEGFLSSGKLSGRGAR